MGGWARELQADGDDRFPGPATQERKEPGERRIEDHRWNLTLAELPAEADPHHAIRRLGPDAGCAMDALVSLEVPESLAQVPGMERRNRSHIELMRLRLRAEPDPQVGGAQRFRLAPEGEVLGDADARLWAPGARARDACLPEYLIDVDTERREPSEQGARDGNETAVHVSSGSPSRA